MQMTELLQEETETFNQECEEAIIDLRSASIAIGRMADRLPPAEHPKLWAPHEERIGKICKQLQKYHAATRR